MSHQVASAAFEFVCLGAVAWGLSVAGESSGIRPLRTGAALFMAFAGGLSIYVL